MSSKSVLFDEAKVGSESVEGAFRRIAARKRRERGCGEAEIPPSIERLLAKPINLEIDDPATFSAAC